MPGGFTRNGDIYIGLTSKSDVVPALYKFDPERYKEINWSNPMPERQQPENLEEFRFGFTLSLSTGCFGICRRFGKIAEKSGAG